MKDEANIVKQYADSDVGERIELLIKHYPNFIRLVEGYEQSLSFIIKQEKESKRRGSVVSFCGLHNCCDHTRIMAVNSDHDRTVDRWGCIILRNSYDHRQAGTFQGQASWTMSSALLDFYLYNISWK